MKNLKNIMKNVYTHHEVCKLAVQNDRFFNTFKVDRYFTPILEHTTHKWALKYIDLMLKNFPSYLEKIDWKKIKENDQIGGASTMRYNIFNDDFSPSTINYVYKGLCILSEIKKLNLNNLTILEIGGGYGGQCKILFDLAEIFNIKIKKYTIIDLKYVSRLQKKYLNKLGYSEKINFVEFENLLNNEIVFDEDYLISVYALGEFVKELQDFYVTKINNILHYYLIWNSPKIHEHFLKSFQIFDEIPKTGSFNKTIIN